MLLLSFMLFSSSIVDTFSFVFCSKVYFANRAFENSLDFVLTALLSKMYLHRIFTISLKSFSSKVVLSKEYPTRRIAFSVHLLVGVADVLPHLTHTHTHLLCMNVRIKSSFI